jgi:hypothetical protein
MRKPPQTYRVTRHGRLLEIQYEPCWMPATIFGEDIAHITATCIYPGGAQVPNLGTQFYQHTLARSIVSAAGGPVDYIDVLMAAEAAE